MPCPRDIQTSPVIKMVSFNPLTCRVEEVHPENDVSILDMAVLFEASDGHFYGVPGTTAALVYGEWLNQQRRAR